MSEQTTLEQRVSALEKEIAELKVQVSVRQGLGGKEIVKKINEFQITSPTLLNL